MFLEYWTLSTSPHAAPSLSKNTYPATMAPNGVNGFHDDDDLDGEIDYSDIEAKSVDASLVLRL